MVSRIIAGLTLAALTLPLFALSAHAETISQCRERAYRYYDAIVAEGTPEAEAAKVLRQDLRACEAR
jgi:hypothetical protein